MADDDEDKGAVSVPERLEVQLTQVLDYQRRLKHTETQTIRVLEQRDRAVTGIAAGNDVLPPSGKCRYSLFLPCRN